MTEVLGVLVNWEVSLVAGNRDACTGYLSSVAMGPELGNQDSQPGAALVVLVSGALGPAWESMRTRCRARVGDLCCSS